MRSLGRLLRPWGKGQVRGLLRGTEVCLRQVLDSEEMPVQDPVCPRLGMTRMASGMPRQPGRDVKINDTTSFSSHVSTIF